MTQGDGPLLRPAVADDVAVLEQIAVAAFSGYVAEIGRPPAPMTADYPSAVRDHEVWVTESAGGAVGFVVLTGAPPVLVVDTVAVHPSHQGLGLGAALLDLAERRARERGAERVELVTNEAMVRNLALYARRGYVETGRGVQHGFRRVFLTKHC